MAFRKFATAADVESAGRTAHVGISHAVGWRVIGDTRSGVWQSDQDGGHIVTDPSDGGAADYLRKHGCWESWLAAFLSRLVEPDSICHDVGASYGYFTALMARRCPQGHVFAYEPNPAVAALLRDTLATNESTANTTVLEEAAGPMANLFTVDLIVPPGRSSRASVMLHDPKAAGHRTVKAAMTTVDCVGPDRCDIIKIDVEGYDHDVLDGCRKKFSQNRDRLVIVMEYTPDFHADPVTPLEMAMNFCNGRLRVVDRDGTVSDTTAGRLRANPSGCHDLVLSLRDDLP